MLADVAHSKIRVDRRPVKALRLTRAAQNIKEQPALWLEPLGRAKGLPFRSCNGLFSAGFPTGVQGVACPLPQLTLRTSFPLPIQGRPFGHREAPLLICNFFRVTQATLVCNSRLAIAVVANCDLLRISTLRLQCKLTCLWESGSFCGKNSHNRANRAAHNPQQSVTPEESSQCDESRA
jgi:hypothetical protein